MFDRIASVRYKVSPVPRKIASKRRTIASKRRNCTFLFHFGCLVHYFESFWFCGVTSMQFKMSPYYRHVAAV